MVLNKSVARVIKAKKLNIKHIEILNIYKKVVEITKIIHVLAAKDCLLEITKFKEEISAFPIIHEVKPYVAHKIYSSKEKKVDVEPENEEL